MKKISRRSFMAAAAVSVGSDRLRRFRKLCCFLCGKLCCFLRGCFFFRCC
jgi:hypothetical protein